MAQEKEYTGTITLGAVTPTYDLESEPEQQKDFSFVTTAMLQAATEKFIGDIEQLPPMFSAIKKDGVALYELARRGEEVELKPRNINIKSFEITEVALPVVHFKVICSTGTYIRSLANDYGAALVAVAISAVYAVQESVILKLKMLLIWKSLKSH